MKMIDRYSTAMHAGNLASKPETTWSDTDVLGAMGLAARHEPLGVAIARMLYGGGQADVLAIIAEETFEQSFRMHSKRTQYKITRVQAEDIATAVLSWYRHGTCQPCGGTGFARIKDTPSLGSECKHCAGTRKVLFEKQFRHEWRELARWLHDQINQTQSRAGQVAMQKIAPTLSF